MLMIRPPEAAQVLPSGTATRGRTSAFARGFLPLLEPGTEFSSKWANLYVSALEEGIREPIVAYEYYHQYYVVEGNKRVSVARRIDAPYLEADVTRILPEPEDSERYRVYKEYLSFYADTKLSALYFSHAAGFSRLCCRRPARLSPGPGCTQRTR